jgi:4a-hydroxytetrahydrobiopterin dehydratase
MKCSRSVFDRQGDMLGHSALNEEFTMFATLSLPEGWRAVSTPPSLFRRFQFDCYRDTRAFLERLAALSEDMGLYPDLGFGTTHVNVTVYGTDGRAPGKREVDFASRAAALAFPG